MSSEAAPDAAGFTLVIDGRTLDIALQEELKGEFLELSRRCKAVICCRSTPLQKSQVVRLVRDQLGVMTLAIGGPFTVCGRVRIVAFQLVYIAVVFQKNPPR